MQKELDSVPFPMCDVFHEIQSSGLVVQGGTASTLLCVYHSLCVFIRFSQRVNANHFQFCLQTKFISQSAEINGEQM